MDEMKVKNRADSMAGFLIVPLTDDSYERNLMADSFDIAGYSQ